MSSGIGRSAGLCERCLERPIHRTGRQLAVPEAVETVVAALGLFTGTTTIPLHPLGAPPKRNWLSGDQSTQQSSTGPRCLSTPSYWSEVLSSSPTISPSSAEMKAEEPCVGRPRNGSVGEAPDAARPHVERVTCATVDHRTSLAAETRVQCV